MLLHVERSWIEEATNSTLSRNDQRHEFSENVGEDGQKNHRHVDCLWLEVKDFLQDRSEARQAKSCRNRVSQVVSKNEPAQSPVGKTRRDEEGPKATYLERTFETSMDSWKGHLRH